MSAGKNEDGISLSEKCDVFKEMAKMTDAHISDFISFLTKKNTGSTIKKWKRKKVAEYIMNGGLHKDDPTYGFELRLASYLRSFMRKKGYAI